MLDKGRLPAICVLVTGARDLQPLIIYFNYIPYLHILEKGNMLCQPKSLILLCVDLGGQAGYSFRGKQPLHTYRLTYLRKWQEDFTRLSTNTRVHSTHVFVTHSTLVGPLEHPPRTSSPQSSCCSVAMDIHRLFGESKTIGLFPVPRNMV